MRELASTNAGVPALVGVSGRRLLAVLGVGGAASAIAGVATYYASRLVIPIHPSILTQAIVVEVYVLLTVVIALAFRPLYEPPLAVRISSSRDLILALGAWLATVALSALAYFLLKPAFGGVIESLRKVLTVATDVKRLEAQPMAAWAMAIPRGCLLAPLFEELFFRGALLQWLRRYLSNLSAIVVSAVLFAVMHGYPVVMPYAFLFGLSFGWIRIRTGSTLNTVLMHVVNNLFFLYLGFAILR